MRHIELQEKPVELTGEVIARLTEEFMRNPKKRVWDKTYIKETLLAASKQKCAYSEVLLNENGSYMEVDHFYPKSIYPSQVVEWGNLVPSCKACNVTKGDADPNEISLLNPYTDFPEEHLACRGALYIGLDEKGRNSISCYGLNLMQFKLPRSRQIADNGRKLALLCDELAEGRLTDAGWRRFRARLESILESAQITQPYSFCIASAIKKDENYIEIKDFLVSHNCWNNRLEELDKGLY